MTNAATTSEIAPNTSSTRVNCPATCTAWLARSVRRWSPVSTDAPVPSAWRTSSASATGEIPAPLTTISSYPSEPANAAIDDAGRPTTDWPENRFEVPKSISPDTRY
jgi:hypothetical protein